MVVDPEAAIFQVGSLIGNGNINDIRESAEVLKCWWIPQPSILMRKKKIR
jgi:hypothetical protein